MDNNSTMSTNTYCLDTELRKLRPAELYILVQILSQSDSWKKLMAIVPDQEASDVPKFNAQHFSVIEQAAQQQKRNAAEIFLDEWGTMGKNRPTLRTLLDLLVKAELFRAADYLAGNVLKEELPKRPECGPAAPVDISDEIINKLLEEKDEETNFNESLIFGLPSEINDNKAMDNESQDSIPKRNMQLPKLFFMNEEFTAEDFENIEHIDIQISNMISKSKLKVSDLFKFSSEHNIEEQRRNDNLSIPTPHTNNNYLQEYEKQEMSSCELPVFVNKFGQSVEQTTSYREMLSDELPTFLNNSTYASSSSSNNSSSDSANLSNLSINQNEMTSAELPQCIHELRVNSASDTDTNDTAAPKNGENITQYALRSQELPITVLKYNK